MNSMAAAELQFRRPPPLTPPANKVMGNPWRRHRRLRDMLVLVVPTTIFTGRSRAAAAVLVAASIMTGGTRRRPQPSMGCPRCRSFTVVGAAHPTPAGTARVGVT